MNFTLMHKNTAVCGLRVNRDAAMITGIGEVYDRARLPVGVSVSGGKPEARSLHKWWANRAIPRTRRELHHLTMVRSTYLAKSMVRSMGLSLSDQYWVRPSNNSSDWERVNFFENGFAPDFGDMLTDPPMTDFPEKINFASPDCSTNGNLQKRWRIAENGARELLKHSGGSYLQEPLNEAIASAAARRLGIDHVPYTVEYIGVKYNDYLEPISVCGTFVTPQTELVPAWCVYNSSEPTEGADSYSHFIGCCERLGVPGAVESVDKMIALDYLIANTDRHYNNFGAVRNADTLEWLGLAPLFDNGTSLLHNQVTHLLEPDADRKSRTFRATHSEQIKLVTSFDWLDFSALSDLDEEASEILRQSDSIDDARRDALLSALNIRMSTLEQIALEQTQNQRIIMTM